MRSTTEVILKQLANEGVKHEVLWGCHWVSSGHQRDAKDVVISEVFSDAVDDALARSIRITALLSKLQASLSDPEGEFVDLLFEQDENGL